MKRNKRPALTSPWKIGFLVSLLLVTVSIGVGFAITRTFGVAWSWIQIGDGSWAFDLDAFLNEMVPLVVIVPVMSLLSYFVITGAVRKYRAYLDSGQDYKHLVKSIRQIDDLQEDRIKSLGDYPELRDFLLKLRKRITDRENALDELEAGVVARQEELKSAEEFASEAAVLTAAISRGPVEGFAEELALSLPDMKRVEKSIREHLLVAGGSMALNDVGEQMFNIRKELSESTTTLRTMIDELCSEMVVSQNGAREIEMYMNQLKTVVGGGATAATAGTGDAARLLALVDRLDHASSALAALGEETKSIAINTALHAGQGESGLTELVKLADSVRDVATRFNGISATYRETGQQVRAAVQAGPVTGGDSHLSETLHTMSDKVTYWVERAVLLAEKLNSFERQFLEVTKAFDSKLGGDQPDDKYQAVGNLSDGIGGGPVESHDGAAPAVGDGFVSEHTQSPAMGIAGLETNRNLFEEIGGGSDDNLFADIPPDGTTHTGLTGVFERDELHTPTPDAAGSQDDIQPSAAEPLQPQAPEPGLQQPSTPAPPVQTPQDEVPGGQKPPTPASHPQGAPVQSPASGPAPEAAPPGRMDADYAVPSDLFEEMGITAAAHDHAKATPQAGEPQTPPDADVQRAQAPHKPPVETEPVYDLYELGAVDYEPSLHTSA